MCPRLKRESTVLRIIQVWVCVVGVKWQGLVNGLELCGKFGDVTSIVSTSVRSSTTELS